MQSCSSVIIKPCSAVTAVQSPKQAQYIKTPKTQSRTNDQGRERRIPSAWIYFGATPSMHSKILFLSERLSLPTSFLGPQLLYKAIDINTHPHTKIVAASSFFFFLKKNELITSSSVDLHLSFNAVGVCTHAQEYRVSHRVLVNSAVPSDAEKQGHGAGWGGIWNSQPFL